MRITRVAVFLALVGALTAPAGAQFNNPGAYTSPQPAGSTTGLNLLFFGNSYTISSANPAVHTPTYGGARGVPELVRQVAIAAGHPAPFVKNVFHLNRGLDYHLSPTNPSLGHIDEPALQGEAWDFVVLQGFSTRPTHHPYTGNTRLLQENAWRMFEQVRAGSTNHTSQHPAVVPVLYQTWARQPDHWFYDVTSPFTAGNNIAIGLGSWTGGALFTGPEEMAAEVRSGYDEAQRRIVAGTPGAAPRIARVGDAWQAADWGRGFANLYANDHYHASSHGDLLTALTIYGTVYGDANTVVIAQSAALVPVLAAIEVSATDAAQLARWADQVLRTPPVAQPPQWPPSAILVDFSDLAGPLVGPELRPVPGRHYNTLRDKDAGRIADLVDTENRRTGVEVAVVDGFAGDTGAGANGGFISAVNLSGSLYDLRAQRDAFFVGRGAGFADPVARVALRGLDAAARYDVLLHGSRESTAFPRVGRYTVQGRTQTLNAAHNLNLVVTFRDVAPDAAGTLAVEITHVGAGDGFGYLGVLELRRSARLTAGPAPAPGETVALALAAPAFPGRLALTATALGLGPILSGPHTMRLDPDALFAATFGVTGSATFSGYAALLDAAGRTQPALAVPALAGLSGLALHTASVVADGTAPGGVAAVSNTWSLRVR